jgi:hypothetical protein
VHGVMLHAGGPAKGGVVGRLIRPGAVVGAGTLAISAEDQLSLHKGGWSLYLYTRDRPGGIGAEVSVPADLGHPDPLGRLPPLRRR